MWFVIALWFYVFGLIASEVCNFLLDCCFWFWIVMNELLLVFGYCVCGFGFICDFGVLF